MPKDEKPVEPVVDESEPAKEAAAETPADEAAEPAMAAGEPAPDSSGPDSKAVIDMLAEAAGLDPAVVVAAMMDNSDAFVAAIQKVCDTGSAQPKQMTAAPDRFVAVELARSAATITALTAEVAALKAASGETAASRVAAHVLQLTASGHIGDGADDQADAVALFSADFARASRVYENKVCPVGVSQATPVKGGTAVAAELTASDLISEVERKSVRCMVSTGTITEQGAIKRVVELRRAGRN